MRENVTYDLVVVGGGPSGATAAHDAVKQGYRVLLLDKAGRIKPCGGAIPPRCVRDFDIPPEMLVADAAVAFLRTGDARELAMARKRFMTDHGKVFWVLGMMQYFWYRNDKRRERFVKMCEDKDVQRLTWESYTNKQLTRQSPMAHLKIFIKDMGHLLGIVRPT